MLPRLWLSAGLGSIAKSDQVPPLLTRWVVRQYAAFYGVNLAEAAVPPGGYGTLEAFFTRRLNPGCRPVSKDALVVSPADGRVEASGQIHDDYGMPVKGHQYSLRRLLGGASEAQRFRDGYFWVIYLSPADYHRVHAPVSGAIRGVRYVKGTLLPVNQFGVRHFPDVLVRNERVVVLQRHPLLGSVATVLIGAIAVGKIALSVAGAGFDRGALTNAGRGAFSYRQLYGSAPHCAAGDELGIFRLGSTVVVATQKSPLGRASGLRGQRVRVGQRLMAKAT